jgi:hypothetical protein
MIGAREVFESFTESNSKMHVELGMGTKHAVKGSGTIPFQLELGGTLRVTNGLWLPKLNRSAISASIIEKKGFDVAFQDGKALINPIGSSLDKEVVFGGRERNLYRLKGNHMQ